MAMYRLVYIAEPNSECHHNGDVQQFPDAASAMAFANSCDTMRGLVKPAILINNSWKYREESRFRLNVYKPLTWGFPTIDGHYAHVSTRHPDKVAFTESPTKGMQDIQTRMTPGKYLRKYYPELSSEEITALADIHRETYGEPATLKWAKTPDEMEAVYSMAACFSSCMQHSASYFTGDEHPCRIYAAGDLTIAYLTQMADGRERLTARALVWLDKDKVGRVYGDSAALRAALAVAGTITTSDSSSYQTFEGAKLLRIEQGDGFIMPYIDRTGSASDHGDHLTIDRDGDIGAESTEGISEDCEPEGSWCEHCEEHRDDDGFSLVNRRTMQGVNYEEHWCEFCTDQGAFRCDHTGEYYSDNAFTSVEVHVSKSCGTETWCVEDNEDKLFHCEGSEEYYHTNFMVILEDGTTWCQDHFDENGFTCEHDGGKYDTADGHVAVEGQPWLQANADQAVADGDLFLLANGTYSLEDQTDLLEDLPDTSTSETLTELEQAA